MSLGNILASSSIYRILNIAVTFILTILMSRLMGTGGYGLFSLIVVNITVYNLVSGFGCESGITYHGAARSFNAGKLFSIIFIILLFQVILLFFTGFFHKIIFGANWFSLRHTWPVFLMFLNIAVTDKYNAMFYGNHQYTLSNKTGFYLSLFCIIIFAVLFFFYPGQGPEVYLQVYALIGLAQLLTVIIIFHQKNKEPFTLSLPSSNEWKIFFSYSIITVITNFIQFLAYRVDYWMISYYQNDNQQLGIYSVAVKLVQLFWILPLLFGGILFPGTAGQREEFSMPKMLSLMRIMNTLNLIAGVIAFFLISWVIPFFFGDAYADGVAPFRWLLPGIILFCDTTILAAYFAGTNRIKINLAGSVICFVIILLFDLLLIPYYGINGAALASCIGYGITGIYYTYRFIKLSGGNLQQMFIMTRSDKNSLIRFLKNTIAY